MKNSDQNTRIQRQYLHTAINNYTLNLNQICTKIKGLEFLALSVFNRNQKQSLPKGN